MSPTRLGCPSPRTASLTAAVLAFVAVSVLWLAPGSRAAELVYWDNYGAGTVSSANIDGSGGGLLNLGVAELENPEGMAYDPVTNRLYVATTTAIRYVNLDGSGGGVFTPPGAPVAEPQGITIDPVTRMIYWINYEVQTISFAPLDGGSGGLINTTGAKLSNGFRLALDPVAGRLYWGNNEPSPPATISWANVNNTGGGTLNIAGASSPDFITGVAVDPAGGRVYWVDNTNGRVSFASLAGSGGGDLALPGAVFNGPYGLAFDPTAGKLFWGNESNGAVSSNAVGVGLLSGVGGGITPLTAPVASPQDPIILKSPAPTGSPAITRAKNSRSNLSCSSGTWGADFPGSFVYQAPRSLTYQWLRNGKAISGATASTLTAKSAGKYTCAVTATNQAGSTAQVSKVAKIAAANAKLTTKKKVTVKAGGTATFSIKATNQGDLKSKNAKVCVKLPKSAVGALKAPKCKALGKLKGRAKKSAKLKIKTLPSASGVYSVSFVVKGSPGKAAKAKIVVVG